jgi:hypothetical protein
LGQNASKLHKLSHIAPSFFPLTGNFIEKKERLRCFTASLVKNFTKAMPIQETGRKVINRGGKIVLPRRRED